MRLPVPALILAIALALPVPSAALTIDAATVAFNPKKTDAFAVKGSFTPFDASGVSAVTVAFGAFTQTIPAASFVAKKGKLSFKGAKGAPGLATLTIDTVKGKLAAAGKNLTLGAFDNPAAFRLTAGFAFDECSTLTFAEVKNKRKLVSAVPACGFAEVPTASPHTIFVNAPTEVRVQVAVVDDLALDLASLVLLRLDPTLQPVGAPACALKDDGSPASGDATAVDGIFSCRLTMTEPVPGRVRFAVRALRDTVLVLSPSVFVDAVTPLTGAEVTAVITAQSAARDAWDAALAALGNTTKARKAAVADILEIPGVANAGIAADRANIFIEYTNGLEGGLDLDPVGDPNLAPFPFSRTALASRSAAPQPVLRASPLAASTTAPRVGNAKVLIWAAFENENQHQRTQVAALTALFQQSTCPKFEVTVLKNEECTLASLETFPDYGTVVLLTHGAQPRADKEVGLMTREKATLQSEWLTYARDLRLERLLVYGGRFPEKHGYFVFFPGFLASVTDRGFPNTVVFAGGCSSAGNRSLANVFLATGALAYVGFTSTEDARFAQITAESFFSNLLQPGTTVTDAFARIPYKTLKQYLVAKNADVALLESTYGPTLTTKAALLRGDGRLTYACAPPAAGLVETVTVAAAPMGHAVGTVRLQAGVSYRLVVTGTATLSSFDGTVAQEDSLYCFGNTSSTFTCNPPFPIGDHVRFYVQLADEEPGFGDLESIADFAGSGIRPYNGAHRYEYPWTGKEGRLWVSTYPSIFPGDGTDITGSFTVQVFRD